MSLDTLVNPQTTSKTTLKQPQIQPTNNLKNNPQATSNTTHKQSQKQLSNNLKTKLQLFVFIYFTIFIIKYVLTLVITLEL